MSDSRDLRIRVVLDAVQRVTAPLKAILGGSKATAKELKALRDRVKELARTGDDLKTFKQLKAQSRAAEAAMAAAEKRVADLAARIREADGPTRKLNAEFKRAKAAAGELKREHQAEARELQVLRTRLHEAGIKTNDLARAERALRDETGRATQKLDEQQKKLKQVADNAARAQRVKAAAGQVRNGALAAAAGGGAMLGSGVAVGGPVMAAVNKAQNVESRGTDIGQKADLTRAQAAAFTHELIAMSPRANKSVEELQDGLDTLAGLGMDPRIAMKAIEPIARASTAYKAAMEDVSASSYAAVSNLKIPVDQVGRAIEIQAYAGKRGAVELRDMAIYLPALSAAYEGLGQQGPRALAGLAAGLQITRKGAGDAASAATNLENLLQKVSAPQTVKAFKDMGVDLPAAMKKAAADGKDPLEAIAELTDKALGGDMSRLGYLFQDAEVQKGLRPLIANLKEYRDIRDQALRSEGAVGADFKNRMQDGLEVSKALRLELDNMKLEQGAVLAPEIAGLAKELIPIVHGVRLFAQAHPGLVKVLAVVAVILTVLGGLVLVIGGIVAGVAAVVAAIGGGAVAGTIAVVVGLVAAFAAVAVAVGWAAKKVVTFLIGIFSKVDMAAIGRALIQGLITGIKIMFPWLSAIIEVAAKMLPKGLRDKLGIKSPSRVFAEIGGHTMGGLAQGIERGQHRPFAAMRAAAAGVAASAAIGATAPQVAFAQPSPATAARGASGAVAAGGGGSTFNITINALPGMNEAALARLVRAELQKVQRSQQAARRSAFSDYGED